MSYTRVNWQNSPNTSTPLSAENLNKMDAGIKQNANDIETLQQHTYDAELNGSSTNAPQNKAVYEAIQQIDIETDPTLTVSGKPADAAATGEAIANVSSAIDALKIVDTASGAIASFSDGAAMPVEGLSVGMEPIQDLNGQDAPYPAGGGKNLLDLAYFESRSTAYYEVDGDDLTVNASDGTAWTSIPVYPLKAGTYTFSRTNTVGLCAIRISDNDYATDAKTIASGVASGTFTLASDGGVKIKAGYSAGSGAYPFNVRLQLELGSTATAYAPYENICPISGRSAVTVTRSGKNLMPYSASDFETGNVLGNGRFLAFTVPAGTYTVSTSAPTGYIWAGKRFVNTSIFRVYAGSPLTLTLEDGESIYIGLLKTDIDAAYAYGVQVEPGSTASSYEPYNGQTATIQLGDTVYGGTVNVTTGVMTVTHAIKTFTSGFNKHGSVPDAYYRNNSFTDAGAGAAYCNQFKYTTSGFSATAYTVGMFSIDTNYTRLTLKIAGYASGTALDAYLAEHPLQVVYPLAEPFTVQLTPAQLTTLKGQNNVWSDADSVTVDYVCDPKLYIARLTEPDADMVADANITSGSYFMVGNSLYLATSNIASGAVITPGVNCTKTNLSAALNAINS